MWVPLVALAGCGTDEIALRDMELEAAIQEQFTNAATGESVVLADLTGFEWTTVGVFPVGTPAERMADALTVADVPLVAEFSDAVRLVFVADGEVVADTDVLSPALYADALTYPATVELVQVGDPNGAPGARLTAPLDE